VIERTVPEGPSGTFGWMLWGGLLGSLVVAVHIALEVFKVFPACHLPLHSSSLHKTSNPFVHVLAEFAILGGGGAVVFGLGAKLTSFYLRKGRGDSPSLRTPRSLDDTDTTIPRKETALPISEPQ
jgi:hypothetical protein